MRAAKAELGKHYSRWGSIRIWRRLVFKVRRRPDLSKPPDKFICSEYVSYAWQQGGVWLAGRGKRLITPGEIAESDVMTPLGLLVVSPDQESGKALGLDPGATR